MRNGVEESVIPSVEKTDSSLTLRMAGGFCRYIAAQFDIFASQNRYMPEGIRYVAFGNEGRCGHRPLRDEILHFAFCILH